MKTKKGKLHAATASPGTPIWYEAPGGTDDGLSVNLYQDDAGVVIGVTVYDQGALKAAAGMVPAEVLLEEVHYAAQNL